MSQFSDWKIAVLALLVFDRGRSFVKHPFLLMAESCAIELPDGINLEGVTNEMLDKAMQKALRASDLANLKKELNA